MEVWGRHRPVRVWWAPWRRRCGCGEARWPCLDELAERVAPRAYWQPPSAGWVR